MQKQGYGVGQPELRLLRLVRDFGHGPKPGPGDCKKGTTCAGPKGQHGGWRRSCTAWIAAAALGLVLVAPANAIQIVVAPQLDTAVVGGTLAFDVWVEELGEEIVSAFDLDFEFDPAVLSFNGLVFGASFGGAADSFSGVETPAPGLVDFFLFSILLDDELAAAQRGSALLARLTFTGLAPGSSPMSVTGPSDDPFFALVGREASALELAAIGSGLAVVRERAVPEPGALTLLGIGLLAVGVAPRRRISRRR
jgi:hypothetical protein